MTLELNEPTAKRFKSLEDQIGNLEKSSSAFAAKLAAFCRTHRAEPQIDLESEESDHGGDDYDADNESGDDADNVETDSSFQRKEKHRRSARIAASRHKKSAKPVSRGSSDEEDDSAAESSDESELDMVDARSRVVDVYEAMRTRIGSWKCTECEKKICGNRTRRLKHIAAHKNFKLRCPINGCNATQSVDSLIHWHIPRDHEMTDALRSQLRIERGKITAKCKEFEREFFPEENFEAQNDFCKKCNAKMSSYQGKKDHIGSHLRLTIPCPVRGCTRRYVTGTLTDHLRRFHKKKLSELSGKTRRKFNKSRKVFLKAVNKVQHEFF